MSTKTTARETERIQFTHITTDVHTEGVGPDIIWLTGGGEVASDWHEDYTSLFAGSYRSVSFDNRGTLGVDCDVPEPWSIAAMAADAAEVIERTCAGPAVVVGHSMGGQIALQLALDRPDLVELSVILAAGARGDVGWLGDYMRTEIELRERGIHLEREFAAIHYAMMMYPANALGDPLIWPRIKESLMSPEVHENTEATIISQWQPCLDFDVLDRVPHLEVPLEVFAFGEDVCSPPFYGRELAAAAPEARLHEVPGLGHASMFLHRPEVVSAIVRRCIDEHFQR